MVYKYFCRLVPSHPGFLFNGLYPVHLISYGIRKTCPCNEYPLNEWGMQGVYLFDGSNVYPKSMFWAKKKKKKKCFYLKFSFVTKKALFIAWESFRNGIFLVSVFLNL